MDTSAALPESIQHRAPNEVTFLTGVERRQNVRKDARLLNGVPGYQTPTVWVGAVSLRAGSAAARQLRYHTF